MTSTSVRVAGSLAKYLFVQHVCFVDVSDFICYQTLFWCPMEEGCLHETISGANMGHMVDPRPWQPIQFA